MIVNVRFAKYFLPLKPLVKNKKNEFVLKKTLKIATSLNFLYTAVLYKCFSVTVILLNSFYFIFIVIVFIFMQLSKVFLIIMARRLETNQLQYITEFIEHNQKNRYSKIWSEDLM